jgi:hypothetical protein
MDGGQRRSGDSAHAARPMVHEGLLDNLAWWSAGMMAAGCSPRTAARRPKVRPRHDGRPQRSSLPTVAALTPARSASISWDSPRWRRNCRNRCPSTMTIHRRAAPPPAPVGAGADGGAGCLAAAGVRALGAVPLGSVMVIPPDLISVWVARRLSMLAIPAIGVGRGAL